MAKQTLNVINNQFSPQLVENNQIGSSRKYSYLKFKHEARLHQWAYREDTLHVGYNIYKNVLKYEDAKKGLIFFEGFRDEIMKELKKPIPSTSTPPSGFMLTNLLRSEHIPYNVFFPMRHDYLGCKGLFSELLSTDDILAINDILIEYHPEPIEEYLNDHTAFDVYIAYINKAKQPCGIGIEVKYTENSYPLKPQSHEYSQVKDKNGNTCLKGRYAIVTKACGYYKEGVSHDILVSNKFRQIWRNHILGASMVLKGNIKKFTSVTLFPYHNVHFTLDVMPKYKEFLTGEHYNEFIPVTFESLFKMMDKHLSVPKKDEWLKYLNERYLF